jgi:acetyltransferase-like isoleucine patch superfamily enzyme
VAVFPLHLLTEASAVLRARFYLRSAETMGPRVRLWGTPVISNRGRLRIGNRVRLSSTVATLEIGIAEGGLLEIGDQVLINYGCSIGVTQHVRIGNRVNIGTHVMLIDNAFHHLDPARRDEAPPSQPIVLEDNVWLAARVIVLPGVTIGCNSVVGAGSVVTHDVPPNVLSAGVPAKVIRSLDGRTGAQEAARAAQSQV